MTHRQGTLPTDCTHLSLCVMAASVSSFCMVVKRCSSRVKSRCSMPSCTCRLPENIMAFRNASTSLTMSSLRWDNKGITWLKQGVKSQSTLYHLITCALYGVPIQTLLSTTVCMYI